MFFSLCVQASTKKDDLITLVFGWLEGYSDRSMS